MKVITQEIAELILLKVRERFTVMISERLFVSGWTPDLVEVYNGVHESLEVPSEHQLTISRISSELGCGSGGDIKCEVKYIEKLKSLVEYFKGSLSDSNKLVVEFFKEFVLYYDNITDPRNVSICGDGGDGMQITECVV